jgi:hypothetical protein
MLLELTALMVRVGVVTLMALCMHHRIRYGNTLQHFVRVLLLVYIIQPSVSHSSQHEQLRA